ncbi:MAG TPA: methyltransferase domain-containing protein [Acidimicrobiales bacterium]
MTTEAYTGVDNLEVMEVATNYRRFLTDLVASVLDPVDGQRVLDFGVGVGTHAEEVRALGYDVSCVETDDTLRERLRSRGFRAVRSPDELGDERFDVVYSFNVLEHIADDGRALRELRRVTAPGGTLVLYVPAFQLLYSAMDRKIGHLRRYRRRQLVSAVEQAGYGVCQCRYADSLGFFATLAYRAGGSRRGDLNEAAVAAYDRYAFPLSRALDRGVGRWFGKNLVLVGRAEDTRP